MSAQNELASELLTLFKEQFEQAMHFQVVGSGQAQPAISRKEVPKIPSKRNVTHVLSK